MPKSTSHVVAEFETPKALLHAAEALQKAGFRKYDAYSPFPIHGLDEAMQLPASKLPWIVLCGGLFGALFGFGFQTWVSVTAYPVVIGGKPLFSYQAFVPVTFELMVLFSAFAAVFGLFGIIRLPKPYDPMFKHSTFGNASSHSFFISISSQDPHYEEGRVKTTLAQLGGKNVEVVKD
ncbi:MAG: DUF3341 domain-containing protein [Candidatus Margulisiibacteriota bacterium]